MNLRNGARASGPGSRRRRRNGVHLPAQHRQDRDGVAANPKPTLVREKDGTDRCWWCVSDPLYLAYHDEEWGFPVSNDRRLFEKICLEGFQAGLSWLTILRKREAFRKAFLGFDFTRLVQFDETDIKRLLADVAIVRHRKKIEATLNNASRAHEIIAEFGSLAAFFWQFEPGAKTPPTPMIGQTEESKRLSLDLKKRGWRFVGPTTAYAFMQAMGLVNDHVEGCHAREKVQRARAAFRPPTGHRRG